MDYPIWDVAIGGGALMGVVAIAHVIVSHFAIGGGLVIAVTETLAWRRGDRDLRDLARRSSFLLIVVSTVFGAISGVGIWVVAGLISPAGISALIRTYLWGWAIEWTMFVVEIIAALIYFATWEKVSKPVHVMIGWVYFISAYLSLVVINGIVTFMLTPGEWLNTGAFWDGFFNPTYWPSILLRTGICVIMAAAFLLFPALRADAEVRPQLVRYIGAWLVAGVALGYAGYRWWEAALPDAVRALFLDESPSLVALADTRWFLMWAAAATLALGIVFLLALPRVAGIVPALLVMLAAFGFFGGYERLREGCRKPYLIHDHMFSNGVLVDEIPRLNEQGILSKARWAARVPTDDPVTLGRQVFRAQCASCHTVSGYLAIPPLLPDDPDMIFSVVYALYDQGEAYTSLAPGERVDKTELTYPFMPPFVGTEDEMEALTAYLATLAASSTPAAEAGGES